MVASRKARGVLGLWVVATVTTVSPATGLIIAPFDRNSRFTLWSTHQLLSTASVKITHGDRAEPQESRYRLDERESPARSSVDPAFIDKPSEFHQFLQRRRAQPRKVLLDLRPMADFRRGHLVGSTSMPVSELQSRMLELPPPFGTPVSIIGTDEDLTMARDLLESKGWQVAREINTTEGADSGGFATQATEVGSHSVQVWRANDFLEFCTERYLLPSDLDGSVCMDLGCGSGRDTVYMAQRLPPGTEVVGVDNHSYALERGQGLARAWIKMKDGIGGGANSDGDRVSSHGQHDEGGKLVTSVDQIGQADSRGENSGGFVGRRCSWLCTDLRKEGSLRGLKASVVHGHRFKCEQLLPYIRDQVLLPGGYFIWSTFLCTEIENLVPPWRPSRMMRPGELAEMFSGEDYDILVDEQGELSTRGAVVPATFFACRRRN